MAKGLTDALKLGFGIDHSLGRGTRIATSGNDRFEFGNCSFIGGYRIEQGGGS